MYDLIPKISTQIIYSAVLKIRNEDNSKIINMFLIPKKILLKLFKMYV